MSRQKYCSTEFRDSRISAGFLHCLRRLSHTIQASMRTHRVLILLPCFLTDKHNAFIPNRKQIYDYLDLDDTRLLVDGKQKLFSYRRLEDLDRKDMANWTVQCLHTLKVENFKISDDGTADLLILFHRKSSRQWLLHLNAPKLSKGLTPLILPQTKQTRNQNRIQVCFSARQEYCRLSEQVVAVLGGAKNYYALHIRRGDRAIRSPELDRATQAGAIIERIQTMVPQGETLFLLSDEKAPYYFKPLEKHWKIVRYHDFPELASLVNHPNPLLHDNNALFLVEGLIYSQARLKICLLYTSPSPRDRQKSRMPSSA